MKEKELRVALVAQARAAPDLGLGPAAVCEISARIEQAMLITPGVRRR